MVPPSLLLHQVQVLEGPGIAPRRADALIRAGRLAWFGSGPPPQEPDGAPPIPVAAEGFWLAPALVDPHSVLEDPWQGRAETLASLKAAAAAGGYGTVALLPWAADPRDRPERLRMDTAGGPRLPLWGSFSLGGEDRELAVHGDQLAAGALGLAGGEGLPPPALLERGLRLGEMGDRPVLLAPRDPALTGGGFLRERVEALRGGWPTEPPVSETLPLRGLLGLAEILPQVSLRLMNLSTREGVELLRRCPRPPPASVCWWHLVADSGRLDPAEEGWRLVPSLGGAVDREALVTALEEGLITAVAIHHLALDREEQLLPLDQRRPGLAGHGVALTLLWEELVRERGWPVERLWQVLCWGPAGFLGEGAPHLRGGTTDWLLYDPHHSWRWGPASCPSLAANQPCWRRTLQGRVIACGAADPLGWPLTALRSC